MREEITKIVDDLLNWSCKHLPCPEEKGCTECGANRILSLFCDKVRGIGVENPHVSELHPEAVYATPHYQSFEDGKTAFRDAVLKELEL